MSGVAERTATPGHCLLAAFVLLLAGCDASPTQPTFETFPASHERQLKGLYTGTLLKQVAFKDVDGAGLLLLSVSDQAVPAHGDDEPMDQITLRAELFRRADEAAPWMSRWSVEDPVQCDGLDLEAGYFLDQVTATDLDNDGRAEVTVASHSFCGGGVDPRQLRIGLHQGEQYYEVRGESQVEVEGDAPLGGERHDAPELARAPVPLRTHMDRVWEAIKYGPSP